MNSVFYHNDSGRAWVTIDNPPLTALSHSVRIGLLDAIASAEQDGCHSAVIVCLGKTFVTAGDYSDDRNPPQKPCLADVLQALKRSPVIWAVALHGEVSGEGFELAMAASIRVASAGTQFGYPEGGCSVGSFNEDVRTTKWLASAGITTESMCGGRKLEALELLAAGGLDAVVSDDLEGRIGELLDAAVLSAL